MSLNSSPLVFAPLLKKPLWPPGVVSMFGGVHNMILMQLVMMNVTKDVDPVLSLNSLVFCWMNVTPLRIAY